MEGNNKNAVILIMTVDIGDGRIGTIEVHSGDDPLELAKHFCRQHGLGDHVPAPLAEHIGQSLSQLPVDAVAGRQSTPSSASQPTPPVSEERSNAFQSPERSRRSFNATRVEELARPKSAPPQRPSASTAAPSRWLLSNATANQQQIQAAAKRSRPKSASSQQSQQSQQQHRSKSVGRERRSTSSPRSDIFERLHAEASLKRTKQDEEFSMRQSEAAIAAAAIPTEKAVRMSDTSRLLTQHMSSHEFATYQEKLYRDGLRLMEEKRAKQLELQEQLLQDWKRHSFHPRLSDKARSLHRVGTFDNAFDVYGQRHRHKMEEKEKESKERMMRECTFKPEINVTSKHIVEEKKKKQSVVHSESTDGSFSQPKGIHERLFEEAITNSLRQQEYESFLEATADRYQKRSSKERDRSRSRSRGRGNDSTSSVVQRDPSVEAFIDRLVNSKRESDLQLERIRKEMQSYDLETGQPLFHPQAGRAPSRERNKAGLPVSEYLFAARLNAEEIKKKIEDQVKQETQHMANTPRALDSSRKMLEVAQTKRLGEIFDRIDDDKDGVILSQSIKSSSLDDATIDAIGPLLKDAGTLLNREQFCSLIKEKMKKSQSVSMAVGEVLFRKVRKVQPANNGVASFHPQLAPKTAKLAARHRSGSRNVFEHLFENGKVQSQFSVHAEPSDEYKECTFEPRITSMAKQTQSHISRVVRGANHSNSSDYYWS